MLVKVITVDEIIVAVANYYKMDKFLITTKRRSRDVIVPRQIAIYLSKRLTIHSHQTIAHAFRLKSHATSLHSCKKIERLLEARDKFIMAAVAAVTNELNDSDVEGQ